MEPASGADYTHAPEKSTPTFEAREQASERSCRESVRMKPTQKNSTQNVDEITKFVH